MRQELRGHPGSLDAFKEVCEMSDWQAYNCVAFLRKVNGCVDASRIQPGPDGDLTCPPRRSKEEKMRWAYTAECEKRKWIMRPVPGGTITCVAPDLKSRIPVGIDICNNPRVMPSEDQCPAAPRETDPPRPVPQPEQPG